jgi:glycosyltransferase involved in cell wall biosynthesis
MKVSAYVPAYNVGATINEAVRSILNQTIPPVEVLVIDDGSTKELPLLPGVKLIRSAINRGRGATRALAMAEAQHKLVLGCDATLRLERNFVERALPWFDDAEVAAVFGWVKEEASSKAANRWRGRHLFKSDLPKTVSRKAALAAGCFVVRKKAVEQIGGFNPSLVAGEDFDLGQRLLNAGFDVVFDPALFAYSYLENSVWEVLERYARWNTRNRMGVWDYLRQIDYTVKVMVPADLRAKDFPAACISLLSPHHQFWKSAREDAEKEKTARKDAKQTSPRLRRPRTQRKEEEE